MDATSPDATGIAGDYCSFASGVRNLAGKLVARLTLRLGDGAPSRLYRRSDQEPSRVLPA